MNEKFKTLTEEGRPNHVIYEEGKVKNLKTGNTMEVLVDSYGRYVNLCHNGKSKKMRLRILLNKYFDKNIPKPKIDGAGNFSVSFSEFETTLDDIYLTLL